MKDNHPIDKYFQDAMEGHRQPVAPKIWDEVEAATEKSSGRKGMVWYIMRAAVVVLMLSIGNWYVQDNRVTEIGVLVSPEAVDQNKPGKGSGKATESNNGPANETLEESKKEQQRKKVMPIMRQTQSRSPIYVNHEALNEVNEEELIDLSSMSLELIQLDPAQLAVYGYDKPSFKLQLDRPVTGKAFYADKSDESTLASGPDFKTKLYAYANSQFDNIKHGRKVELPRTGKPQLQINIDKLLNN